MDAKAESILTRVDIYLRGSQTVFLEHLAEAQSVDESRALRRLIDKRMAKETSVCLDDRVKRRRQPLLYLKQLFYIDRLGLKWGSSTRSDTIRRIIDDAMAEQQAAEISLRNVA